MICGTGEIPRTTRSGVLTSHGSLFVVLGTNVQTDLSASMRQGASSAACVKTQRGERGEKVKMEEKTFLKKVKKQLDNSVNHRVCVSRRHVPPRAHPTPLLVSSGVSPCRVWLRPQGDFVETPSANG